MRADRGRRGPGGRRTSTHAGGATPGSGAGSGPGSGSGSGSGSGQAAAGVPEELAAILELLGRRYALAAFWSLRGGSSSFRSLAGRVGAPESQLSQRMRELREAGLVEVDEVGEYRLTSHGRRLLGVLEPLSAWAQDWVALSPRQRIPKGSASHATDEPDPE
ncbi:helix-turn-helix domain-containing protein [Parafrankia sp. EAN1pec]|uniref:winged helix-turn-helix transcriptional regulator n=1 Tax=Parafrankia sp. (strain EAN1pec) TaxID=298653 RepID=UPI003219FC32